MTNRTITTNKIKQLVNKVLNGISITRNESIFYNKKVGTLRADVGISYTEFELSEYVKCSNDIFYFIENYCKIGNDKIILRDYQKEIIEHYLEYRFSLFLKSRQIGFDLISSLIHLHSITFNINHNILLIENKMQNAVSHLDKMKELYLNLPYFLKKGVVKWNRSTLELSNGSSLNIGVSYKKEFDKSSDEDSNISYDSIWLNDFAYFKEDKALDIYKNAFTEISKCRHKRFIIASSLGNNHFTELVRDSLRKHGDPKKNIFKTLKTYWWEVKERDENWKSDVIKKVGLESFEKEYDLIL